MAAGVRAREEEHVLGLPTRQGPALLRDVPRDRQAGVELEPGAGSRRERADGAESTGADEEGPSPAWSQGGCDQADVEPAQVLEPAESLEEVLERREAVAEPCRLFVAEALGQVGEAPAKPGC